MLFYKDRVTPEAADTEAERLETIWPGVKLDLALWDSAADDCGLPATAAGMVVFLAYRVSPL